MRIQRFRPVIDLMRVRRAFLPWRTSEVPVPFVPNTPIVLPRLEQIPAYALALRFSLEVPRSVLDDDGTRTIFRTLRPRQNEILTKAREIYFATYPDRERAAQGGSAEVCDFWHLVTLFEMRREEKCLDALLVSLGLAVAPRERDALAGEIKCMVDYLQEHLGEVRATAFPVECPTAVHAPVLVCARPKKFYEVLIQDLERWRKRDDLRVLGLFSPAWVGGGFSMYQVGTFVEHWLGDLRDAENLVQGLGIFLAYAGGGLAGAGATFFAIGFGIRRFVKKVLARHVFRLEERPIPKGNHAILKEVAAVLADTNFGQLSESLQTCVEDPAFFAKVDMNHLQKNFSVVQTWHQQTEALFALLLETPLDEEHMAVKAWRENSKKAEPALRALVRYFCDVSDLMDAEDAVRAAAQASKA